MSSLTNLKATLSKRGWFSRKVLLALIASAFIVLNDQLHWGIDSETINQIVILVGGWIGIEGAADIAERYAKSL